MSGCAVDSIVAPRPIPAYTPAEAISCQQGTVIVYWSGRDQAAGVKAAMPHQHGHLLVGSDFVINCETRYACEALQQRVGGALH